MAALLRFPALFACCLLSPGVGHAQSAPPTAAPPKAPENTENAEQPPTPGQQAPAITHLGGSKYELNGISFDSASRRLSFPAQINLVEGLLEYAIVHESGKLHESLLSTTVSPYDLHVVLLLLNYQPSATFFDWSDKESGAMPVKNPKIEPLAQILVQLEWKDEAGVSKKVPLEFLLLNVEKKAPVSAGFFAFTGSMLSGEGQLMARETGSILALYNDPASLVNNPRAGSDSDDIWIADKSKAPAKGTAITVTFFPPPKK